jgi:hypothetical protein
MVQKRNDFKTFINYELVRKFEQFHRFLHDVKLSPGECRNFISKVLSHIGTDCHPIYNFLVLTDKASDIIKEKPSSQ